MRPFDSYPFDPNIKTVVLTDASHLYGIGLALIQVYQDKLTLIQCGSASLFPTQSRYSTVRLECLAIVHAIHLLQNQHLMRMREKLISYNFSVIWTPGKSHYIADTLSRAPVLGPCELSFEPEHLERCLRIFDTSLMQMDPSLDKRYMETMRSVRSGKNATHRSNTGK